MYCGLFLYVMYLCLYLSLFLYLVLVDCKGLVLLGDCEVLVDGNRDKK